MTSARSLGGILLALLICGCKSLPPSRVCAGMPSGSFVSVPSGWVSPDGKEHPPAVDNAGIALAAKLSYLAYQPDEQIKALGTVEIGEVGIDPGGQFPHLFGTKYFVWHDTAGSRWYVVVRGTANFENIIEDINYPKIFDPELGIWVHGGYDGIARKILARLGELNIPRGEQIWVTGHSLGGGVALLVYLHLHHDGRTLGPLYTFGQPRTVARDAWDRYRCLPIVRVVNYGDFVPLVPPTKKDQGCDKPWDPGCNGSFIQLGDELTLAANGGCEYRTYHDANAIGFDSLRTLIEDVQHKELKKYLGVHLQDSYYERTRPLADNPGLACTFRPRP
jgi:hypothetical protein